jgi:hypothetical protein
LIRNSVRSSDRLWLACRISTEHQHMLERRTTAAGAVGPRHSPFQIRPRSWRGGERLLGRRLFAA